MGTARAPWAPDRPPPYRCAMAERQVQLNGIELNVVEEGDGPPVVLCHGFPELAFSWRHQIPALAREAGYRVVAPDMRGFGQSSAPQEIEAYDVVSLCGDMTGAARRARRGFARSSSATTGARASYGRSRLLAARSGCARSPA